MSVRYFVFTHPDFSEPTGIFRQTISHIEVVFEYLDRTDQWVEDDALSRHLVFGSTHVEEVSPEVGEAVVARFLGSASERGPGPEGLADQD